MHESAAAGEGESKDPEDAKLQLPHKDSSTMKVMTCCH